MKATNLTYRPADVADFEQCLAIDHNYQTSRIWQMVVQQKAEEIRLHFQPVRLPQTANIAYPFNSEELPKRWWEMHWFLIGEREGKVQAYATGFVETMRPIAWIGDLVVAPAWRRRGVGAYLLGEAQQWARQERARYLMVSLPMKNDPAMQFFKQNGFGFCGYNEAQFAKRDIDLYFSIKL